MAAVQPISSTDNPKVKAAAKLRDAKHRKATGTFMVESLRDLERAIAAGLAVRQLFFCRSILSGRSDDETAIVAPLLAMTSDATETYQVTEPILRKLAYRENPTGIVAIMEQPAWTENSIFEARENGDTVDKAGESGDERADDTLILIAQGLAKPGNLGAMARTAAAAGCAGMIIVDAVVDPFNPNAIRASTGAVFSLPIICMESSACRSLLVQNNVRAYAAALTPEAIDHTQARYSKGAAVVIGPEDVGLAEEWLAFCSDHGAIIRIPMAAGDVDSLNASVAAGILLFEVLRQRCDVP